MEGDEFAPDEITYIPHAHSYSYGITLEISRIQNAKRELYEQLRHPHNYQNDMRTRAKKERISKIIGKDITSVNVEEFIRLLPNDYTFMLENEDIVTGLAHVFLGYRFQVAEELEKKTPHNEIEKKLGPAPWDVVNDALGISGFPYRVVSPRASALLAPYEFLLVDQTSGVTIKPHDLSSGEKVLLQLVLWLYNSKTHNRFPRLLIIDEPDAHLHPSMTRQFMSVINEILIRRFKARVIMTTHSPSTVALAPDGSIFELSRNAAKITPSKSKSSTIGLLTAGLVTVSEATRFILVEDNDDVIFYSAVRDILTDYGPSKDQMAIEPSPTLVFLPASIGRGKNKIGGGKGIVQQWVEKFDSSPLDQIFKGIIDRDLNNQDQDRVKTISRYSIENYLLDPIVVFGLLIESKSAAKLEGISVSAGDEHLLRELDTAKLQSVVDIVTSQVETKFSSDIDKTITPVSFTNGQKLQYPTWMISYRGHDLLPIFQSVYGHEIITPPNLIKAFQRVRMIPKELSILFRAMQTS